MSILSPRLVRQMATRLPLIALLTMTPLISFGESDSAVDQAPAGILNTRKFFTRNYYPIDYAGQNQMYEIVQDPRGVMYFGNNVTGILEYDGIEWRTIPLSNNNTAFSLAIDNSGTVFVGGSGEIGYLRMNHGVSQYRSLMAHVPARYKDFGPSQVRAISSGVYFKVGTVILRWHEQKMSVIANARGQTFENIYAVHDRLYTSDENGTIFRIDGANQTVIFEEQPEIYNEYFFKNDRNQPSVNFILPYGQNNLIIGSYRLGLIIHDGKEIVDILQTEATGLIKENLGYTATIFDENHIAIGLENQGLIIIDMQGNLKAWFNEDNGLINNGIVSIYRDNQNFIWIGTSYGCSQLLYPSPFSLYDASSGIDGEVRMTASIGEVIYVVTSTGAFRADAGVGELGLQFERIKGSHHGETGVVKVFGESLLFGSVFGLFQLQGMEEALAEKQSEITRFESRGSDYLLYSFLPFRDKDCRFIEVSKKYPGIVYAAAAFDGLYILKHEDQQWHQLGHIEITDPIFFGQEEPEGSLWLTGMNTGGYHIEFPDGKLENPTVTNYYTDDGLPKGFYATSVVDNSVYLYSDEAFFKFDRKAKKFVADNTFFEDPTLTGFVNQAPDGNVWLTKGRPRRLSQLIRGPDGTFDREYSPFQRFDRFQIRNFGYDHHGVTWFGSEKLLLSYDPNHSFDYQRPFDTIIRKITVGDNPIFGIGAAAVLANKNLNPILQLREGRIQFRHDSNEIRFDFAGLYIDTEFPNTYQVRLEGLNTNWSAWSKATYKEYSNLDPGKYRFLVKGKNLYGTMSTEAYYVFEILPPWWETWWFYLSEIGILFGLLATSIMMNRTGEASKFAKTMALVTIVVLFETLMFFVEPVAERYAGSIPVVQLGLNICLALALGPAENILEKFLIGRRRRRKYRLSFDGKGNWSGGAQIIPTLSDIGKFDHWVEAFHKEFDDVGRKYGRYVSNDWVLDDIEKSDLVVELEDLLGGLLLFRRHVTEGQPNNFLSLSDSGSDTYEVKIHSNHWTGTGHIERVDSFKLDQFIDSYQEMIKDVETMFATYTEAMKDHVLSIDERKLIIGRIEPIFFDIMVIIRTLSVEIKNKGESAVGRPRS